MLGDFRDYIKLEDKTENLRAINECCIHVEELFEFLNNYNDRIFKIHYFQDKNLQIMNGESECEFKEVFKGFHLEEVK